MKYITLSLALLTFSGLDLKSQSFEFLDDSNNPIGSEYLFVDNGSNLSLTKVHVRNSASSAKAFKLTAHHLENPTNVDLQICFAGGCFVIAGNTDSTAPYTPGPSQSVDGAQIFDDLKIGPFSGAWNMNDSATWHILMFDEADSTDFTEVVLKWKAGEGSTQTSLEFVQSSQSLRVFPNPSTDQLVFEGFPQDAVIELFDLEGKLVLQESMQTFIEVDFLPRGTYISRVRSREAVLFEDKIILK